jgi:acetyl-CoA acyltransferase
MPKADERPFQRAAEIHDTTIGWRFVNPLLKRQYGIDSMPETAENVAERLQDRARGAGPGWRWLRSQMRTVAAQKSGFFDAEITPVVIPQKKGDAIVVAGRASARHQPGGAGQALKGVVRRTAP